MKLFVFIFLFSSVSFAKPTPKKPTSSEILGSAVASDWRTPDPSQLLYMELNSGRVIIELAPDFAPNHVANVKALAGEKYWDGLAIIRVQDNYVVQWADPNSEKPDAKKAVKKAQLTLNAEFDHDLDKKIPFTAWPDKDIYTDKVGFSNGFAVGQDLKTKKTWVLHCYGAVGAGRDVDINSGGGTELYAVIGHAPRHLDRNVTVLGRVISGMDLLSSLPRGKGGLGFYEKPEQHVKIKSIHLASEVPEKDRTNIEILKTDTALFQKYVEARRHRTDDWFHYSPGHLDICSFAVPTREKPAQ